MPNKTYVSWETLSNLEASGGSNRWGLARKKDVEFEYSWRNLHETSSLFRVAVPLKRTYSSREKARAAKKQGHYILDLRIGAVVR